MGRTSDSPYNAAPLNNFKDHQPEGRRGLLPLSDFRTRQKYLQKTKRYLDDIDYKPTDKDILFLKTHAKYYA